MRQIKLFETILAADLAAGLDLARMLRGKNRVPVQLFLLMCLNLVIAPAVYAAAGREIERFTAWTISLLGLLTLGLSLYLFVVIFQPERF